VGDSGRSRCRRGADRRARTRGRGARDRTAQSTAATSSASSTSTLEGIGLMDPTTIFSNVQETVDDANRAITIAKLYGVASLALLVFIAFKVHEQ
jgi:hypothetical protein